MSNWIRCDFMTVLICFICHLVESLPILQEVRLSVADVASVYSNYEPEGPGSYAFGYDIDDPETENNQFRDEERYSNGTVVGSYGWVSSDGDVHMVRYTADSGGYRARVENMSGLKKYQSRSSGQLLKSLQT